MQAQAASFEELSSDEDPAWLADYQPGGILPDDDTSGLSFMDQSEPADDDSATYPATQALNAVTGSDSSEFSLDALLSEIERHIPQSETSRPRLKPLPSWNQPDPDRADAQAWTSFEPLIAGEDHVPPPSKDMLRFAPGFSQETQPSRSVMDEAPEQAWDMSTPMDMDEIAPPLDITPPAFIAPPEPADEMPAFEEPGGVEAFDEMAFEAPDFDAFFATEPDTPAGAALPPEFADEALPFEMPGRLDEEAAFGSSPFDAFSAPEPALADDAEAAFEAFFAAELEIPAETAPSSSQAPDEDLAEIFEGLLEDAASAIRAAAPDEAILADASGLDEGEISAFDNAEEQGEWAWDEAPLPDEATWTPEDTYEQPQQEMPYEPRAYHAEAATVSPDAYTPSALDGDADEDTRLAHAAVELTRFALESSAQAVLLTRGSQRLAEAGDMPVVAMDRLYDIVTSAWQTRSATPSLMRYIRLPDLGEFMLYSTVVEDDLILSMIFHSGMSIHATRRLAQPISTSLASVPDAASARPAPALSPEPDGYEAPPSADDLREAAERALEQAAAGKVPARQPSAEIAEIQSMPPDEPAAAYTCFWLIADPSRFALSGDLAEDLQNWIAEVAQENAWEVQTLEIGSDSVVLTVSIPQKTLPDSAVTVFMAETASAATAYYPEITGEVGRLWADGYYLITPPRELTDREMARFAAYQYQQ